MSKKRKAWDKNRVRLRRTVETRGLPKQTFLIICEGEKTEPNYFDAFKVKSAKILIQGTGCNTISLVTEAQKIVNSYETDNIEFDQVWCVAINRAKRLLSNYSETNPNKEEPSTTVHLLVEELNKYI